MDYIFGKFSEEKTIPTFYGQQQLQEDYSTIPEDSQKDNELSLINQYLTNDLQEYNAIKRFWHGNQTDSFDGQYTHIEENECGINGDNHIINNNLPQLHEENEINFKNPDQYMQNNKLNQLKMDLDSSRYHYEQLQNEDYRNDNMITHNDKMEHSFQKIKCFQGVVDKFENSNSNFLQKSMNPSSFQYMMNGKNKFKLSQPSNNFEFRRSSRPRRVSIMDGYTINKTQYYNSQNYCDLSLHSQQFYQSQQSQPFQQQPQFQPQQQFIQQIPYNQYIPMQQQMQQQQQFAVPIQEMPSRRMPLKEERRAKIASKAQNIKQKPSKVQSVTQQKQKQAVVQIIQEIPKQPVQNLQQTPIQKIIDMEDNDESQDADLFQYQEQFDQYQKIKKNMFKNVTHQVMSYIETNKKQLTEFLNQQDIAPKRFFKKYKARNHRVTNKEQFIALFSIKNYKVNISRAEKEKKALRIIAYKYLREEMLQYCLQMSRIVHFELFIRVRHRMLKLLEIMKL